MEAEAFGSETWIKVGREKKDLLETLHLDVIKQPSLKALCDISSESLSCLCDIVLAPFFCSTFSSLSLLSFTCLYPKRHLVSSRAATIETRLKASC